MPSRNGSLFAIAAFAGMASAPCAHAASGEPERAAEPPGQDESAVALAGGGAARPLRDLTTDRPDVTESPFAVDAGHIQIESTLLGYTRRRAAPGEGPGDDAYTFAETNLRIGLTERFEVDVVWQPYGIVDPQGAGRSDRGIGPVTLRAKYNLWGNAGLARAGDTALALLPYVTIPTASANGIGESETAFGLIVPLAIDLGSGLGLGLNGAVNFSRTGAEANPAYGAAVLASASLAYEWTDRLGTYAEAMWQFSRGAGAADAVTLDTGVTYALGPDWQLDAGINIGLTRGADPLAPFIGITARF